VEVHQPATSGEWSRVQGRKTESTRCPETFKDK
jgi:hypothetical protein